MRFHERRECGSNPVQLRFSERDTQQAYEAKKYAFVADYVRLRAIKEYGGVYLDIDQELIKPLDAFLAHRAFLGFMREDSVSMGIIGAEPHHPTICALFKHYDNRKFIVNSKLDLLPITDWVTERLINDGLKLNDSVQEINGGVVIYPREYFCPTYCTQPKSLKSKRTVSIHHWAMTWRTETEINQFAELKKSRKKTYMIGNKIMSYPKRIYRKIKRTFNWK